MNHPENSYSLRYSSALTSALWYVVWAFGSHKIPRLCNQSWGPLLHNWKQAKCHRNKRGLASLAASIKDGKHRTQDVTKGPGSSVVPCWLLDQDVCDPDIPEVLILLYILTESAIWHKHSGGHLAIIALQNFKITLSLAKCWKISPTCVSMPKCTLCVWGYSSQHCASLSWNDLVDGVEKFSTHMLCQRGKAWGKKWEKLLTSRWSWPQWSHFNFSVPRYGKLGLHYIFQDTIQPITIVNNIILYSI